MSERHAVPDELLLDYAVGSTPPGKALLVATHLAMRESSRQRFDMLQAMGGALLETLQAAPLERISAETVLARADEADGGGGRAAAAGGGPERPAAFSGKLRGIELPAPLARVARAADDPRAWRTLGLGVEAAVLPVSTRGAKTQLLRARPGVRIMRHTHRGEELVLLLKGAFRDGDELFAAGDVAVADAASTHAPVIDERDECLCLAVTEGPIRFVGPYGWAFNLLNRF